jgi:uncharacterized protein involved in exopolysaccharide biosynthesis
MTTPQPLRSEPGESRAGRHYEESTLFQGIRFLRRHWKGFALWAFIGFAVGAGWSFLIAPRFRATARIALPPTPSRPSLGAFGSLQAMFGLTLGSGNYSPEFIRSLVRGRNMVDSVLVTPADAEQPDGRTLAEYLLDDDSLDAREFADARETLRGRLSADLEVRTGVIALSFWDTAPEVADRGVRALLQELNRQLIGHQRTFALARREYLAQRVADAQAQLAKSERELAAFRETNRNVRNSPLLQLEAERLNRRVSMALQFYTSLQEQLDAAELELRSDIPQLMIVEDPEVPVRKFFPRRRIMALAAAALAAFLYATWVTLRPLSRPAAG